MRRPLRGNKPNWSNILHVIEILVIAILGVEQVRLNARVNAEPAFKIEFAAEATRERIYHIPNVHVLIQPATAFTIPAEFMHKLTIRNIGRVKATQIFVKNTIAEGTPFRFALVAVRDDATGAFTPEDGWSLHFVDARTFKYVDVSLTQLRQGGQVSIFFAIAYPGERRSGTEPDALTVVVDASEIRTIGGQAPAVFPIWYSF